MISSSPQVQIAQARARFHATKSPEHARQLLMRAGIPWRAAGVFVLMERRKK